MQRTAQDFLFDVTVATRRPTVIWMSVGVVLDRMRFLNRNNSLGTL